MISSVNLDTGVCFSCTFFHVFMYMLKDCMAVTGWGAYNSRSVITYDPYLLFLVCIDNVYVVGS